MSGNQIPEGKERPTKAGNDSDEEDEDVFHDARFPAEEEAVSSVQNLSLSLMAYSLTRHFCAC